MNRLSYRTIVLTFAGISIAFCAQGSGQEIAPPRQSEHNQDDKVSLTGCLTKGAETNQYVITDQLSREKVTFEAPAQFYRFVNTIVRVTGHIVSRNNQERVFQPQTLAPLSSSCDSAQGC